MTVTKYKKMWLSHIVGIDGVIHQRFFDTEYEGKEYESSLTLSDLDFSIYQENQKENKNNELRHKSGDLPEGLYEIKFTLTRQGKRYHYVAIKAVCIVDGKRVSSMKNFNIKVSRDEAIEIVNKWRLDNISKHEQKIKRKKNAKKNK